MASNNNKSGNNASDNNYNGSMVVPEMEVARI